MSEVRALLVTPHIKCLYYHKVYLITDHCSAECLLTFWWSSESSWSSPSSQSSESLVGRLEGDLFQGCPWAGYLDQVCDPTLGT